MDEMESEKPIKLVLIGSQGSGKTCIALRRVENYYVDGALTTIGVEYNKDYINVNGMNRTLHIYDTSGQEMFKSLSRSYLRETDGLLIVYDVTKRETFNDIPYWIKFVKDVIELPVTILVANKCDRPYVLTEEEELFNRKLNESRGKLQHYRSNVNTLQNTEFSNYYRPRVVTHEEGVKLADENHILYMETSAKSGEFIDETFITLVTNVLNKQKLRNDILEDKDKVYSWLVHLVDSTRSSCC